MTFQLSIYEQELEDNFERSVVISQQNQKHGHDL